MLTCAIPIKLLTPHSSGQVLNVSVGDQVTFLIEQLMPGGSWRISLSASAKDGRAGGTGTLARQKNANAAQADLSSGGGGGGGGGGRGIDVDGGKEDKRTTGVRSLAAKSVPTSSSSSSTSTRTSTITILYPQLDPANSWSSFGAGSVRPYAAFEAWNAPSNDSKRYPGGVWAMEMVTESKQK